MSRIRDVLRLTYEGAQTGAKIKRRIDMKYILMMNCPKNGYDTFGAWPKEDIQAHIGFMVGFCKELKESGELVAA